MTITTRTGSYALLDTLVKNNVKCIFGYPGGAILPIYDELYHWENKGILKHYLVRHEQSAAHAADGYARSTGQIGVCFATSGPGATNLVTGIATAQMDSIPIVIITGQVSRPFIGTDAFQEIDIFGITLPIVKHSYVVKDPRDIPRIISEAFYISKHGRPGPVLIDIPKDVGLEEFEYNSNNQHISFQINCRPILNPSLKQIKQFIKMIINSKQPLLYVGGGAVNSNASLEIKRLAEDFKIPITTTLMGKGIFDENHYLSLGMLGMHGTAYANYAVSECDLLIALGVRFDDRVTGKLDEFACNAQVIHIDIDPAEIGKNRIPQLAIVSDIKTTLHTIISDIDYSNNLKDLNEIDIWLNRISKWKEDYPLHIPNTINYPSPQEIIATLAEFTTDAYISTDVGQHQMWAAQFLKVKPKRWLSSSGLGTMGYGLPAAIGAKIGNKNKKVICITGDASFQMNIQELGTISQYQLDIKIFILNNHWQGMVRQWQQTFYGERYSHSNMKEGQPNFVKLANAYGIKGISIQDSLELKLKLQQIIKMKEPMIIDCKVINDENCYPMISPGKSNSEMIGLIKNPQHIHEEYHS
uniref:Acetolactate synthase n=1 Tax=Cyanidium sp. THAL103 TaxID=3027999 RepID=A0A9Y1MXU8_9RHOD|nr:acetohydroxyacid synthase large subunit [Cyanidium sp. THAL103]